ncbi:MAG: DUF5946 family protein [Spirochaetota bacterium]
MQDWRQQATENHITIVETGECQFCRAPLQEGVSECVAIAANITHKINHADGIKNKTIFLCVDAHTLQHTEIHGRWSNHFHLSRLQLILNRKIQWNYELSPLLSRTIDEYKKAHPEERILAPKIGQRGLLTVYDILNAKEEREYIELVNQWAKAVYDSYANGHGIAEKIAYLFQGKI